MNVALMMFFVAWIIVGIVFFILCMTDEGGENMRDEPFLAIFISTLVGLFFGFAIGGSAHLATMFG